MTRLADDDVLADIRAGDQAQGPDQGSGRVREEVAVEVWRDDDVVGVGVEEEFVEEGVDDLFFDA